MFTGLVLLIIRSRFTGKHMDFGIKGRRV